MVAMNFISKMIFHKFVLLTYYIVLQEKMSKNDGKERSFSKKKPSALC